MLSELQNMLKRESDKLKECRGKCKQCLGGSCSGSGNGNCPGGGNTPGRGGVSRGRGDAEMSYGNESDKKNTKFKDVILPPGLLDEPKNDVVATTPREPEVNPAESAPRSAARASDASSGRETWERKLRPRHRGVVRRYFDGKAANSE
jgi:hypothetical protein